MTSLSESDAMARDLKDGTLSGFLGAGIELVGEVSFKESMRIDGHFQGKISSEAGKLIVGDKALVGADVMVATVQIQGTVNGNVTASQRVELGRNSKVIGNIQTPVLTVEEGAVFDGNCLMTK
jgi:cytoskeletal protein CcmA (bactofilin family)